MVKHWIKVIGSLFLFVFLIFETGKVFFLLFFNDMISLCGVTTVEKMAALFQGFRVDLAAISYFLIIPFLLLSLYTVFQKKIFIQILKYYFLVILILSFLLIFGEIGLYREWKSKISVKIFTYLSNPAEIYRSTSGGMFFLLLSLTVVSVAVFFYLYTKLLHPLFLKIRKNSIWGISFFPIGFLLLFVFIRGGLQPIPISQSSAYFSSCEALNHAALNPVYNMIRSIHSRSGFNKGDFFTSYPEEEARARVTYLNKADGKERTRIMDTTVQRPNIVFIIGEGWSADLIESLSGTKGVTPSFAELEKEGTLFTRMYSNGTRSQQGIAGVMSGFPAIPNTTVSGNPELYYKVQSLVADLKRSGYRACFTYGGSLDYGNLKAYLTFCGYDKIIDENNFPLKGKKGRLGYHDEDIFQCALNEINATRSPFIHTIFTQSSHPPFDYPKRLPVIMKDSVESDYINSVHYSDSQLGAFIQKAKKEKWYDNTLFVFIADHNHPSHKNHDFCTDSYRHIPMLWFGNVIAKEWQGKQVDKLGSHGDVAKTLLEQLAYNSSRFIWSKDLLDRSSKEFALVEFDDGLGWITKSGYFYYDFNSGRYYVNTIPESESDSIIRDGRSYLQIIMNDYLR